MEGLVSLLWGPLLLGLFLLTGLVCSLSTGFFQLFGLPLWWRSTLGSLAQRDISSGGGISPRRALCTALASTVGTGSIGGVATALCLGGPGAIFWMWVSALLGMMTGCFEKLLSLRYHISTPQGGYMGGPMYYMRDGVGSPLLARWFSLMLLPATLAGGNLVQSAAISTTLSQGLSVSPLAVGLGLMALVGGTMAGGIRRISALCAKLVPAMALLYLGGGLLVLLLRWQAVPQALQLIFTSALCPEAGLAGGGGFALSVALRQGVARGVFTNEAGLGTSAMAHGASSGNSPAQQGLWGMAEVFLSTLVVCTTTALVILVSGVYSPSAPLGTALTTAAFSAVLGPVGAVVVGVSLLLFALSSLLGWSYYGEVAVRYLRPQGGGMGLYRLIFLAVIPLGGLLPSGDVWLLVDLCNALLALPNLLAILYLAPEASRCLRQWISTQ